MKIARFEADPKKLEQYRKSLKKHIDAAPPSALSQALSYLLCYLTHLETQNARLSKQIVSNDYVNQFVAFKAKHSQRMYLSSRTIRRVIQPKKLSSGIQKRSGKQKQPPKPQSIQENHQGAHINLLMRKFLDSNDQSVARANLLEFCNYEMLMPLTVAESLLKHLNDLSGQGRLGQVSSAVKKAIELIQFQGKIAIKLKLLIQNIAVSLDDPNYKKAVENIRLFTMQLLQCDKVTMYIVDQKNQELRSRPKSDLQRIIVLPFSSGLAGQAAETGKIVNVQNAHQCKKFNSQYDKMTKYLTKTVLCVPVKSSESKVVAVMQAINKKSQPCVFTDLDALFLSLIGRFIKDTLITSFKQEDTDTTQNLSLFVNLLIVLTRTKYLLEFIMLSEQIIKVRFGFFSVHIFFYQEQGILGKSKDLKTIALYPAQGSMVAYLQVLKKSLCVRSAYSHPYFNKLIDCDTSLPMCLFPIWNSYQQILGCIQIVTTKGFVNLQERVNPLQLKSSIEQVLNLLSEIIFNLYQERFNEKI